MEPRGLIGGFYRLCEWIMRLSAINLLWVICSLPFFFFLFAYLYSPQGSPITWQETAFWTAVVSPFTLFPATAAMFAVARKWVTGDPDVPLFRTFFRSWKENYLQSLLGGFVYILLAAILYTNFQFYSNMSGLVSVISIIFLVIGIFIFGSLFHFFSVMVHMHMTFWQLLKNAIILTLGNPIGSVVMILMNAVIIYVCLLGMGLLLPVFFMGTIVASVSFWQFHRMFVNIQIRREQLEAEEQANAEDGAQEDGAPGDKA